MVTKDVLLEYQDLPYWLSVAQYPEWVEPKKGEVGAIVKKSRVVRRIFIV